MRVYHDTNVSETTINEAFSCLNVAELLLSDLAIRYRDRVAIVDQAGHVSYAALSALTLQITQALLELGCRPGSRVLVCVDDSARFVAALLAALKAGAVGVPVGASGNAADYAFYLEDTGASIAIADPQCAHTMQSGVRDSSVKVLILDEMQPFASVDAWKVGSLLRNRSTVDHETSTHPANPALILYTSGSTGKRKAVVHRQGALLTAFQNVGVAAFGLNAGDRILSSARLSFAFGLGFGMYMPLLAGASTILMPTKDVQALAKALAAFQPTIVCGVPSLLHVLLRASESWLELDLSSLRFLISAGEPLSEATFDGYKTRFGLEVLDGIGSTESLTHFITNRPGQARRGSCGTPVPGCAISLVDDLGHAVPDGSIGSLRVRTDTAFLGYWGTFGKLSDLREREEIATGDMLYRDRDGYYYYCGRDDDMLKVSGVWVSSYVVESTLSQHPDVERCAVTVREDNSGRRRLVAYLVARESARLNIADLHRFASEHLDSFMVPSAFVAVAQMPLTPNGKLSRTTLPRPNWGVSR